MNTYKLVTTLGDFKLKAVDDKVAAYAIFLLSSGNFGVYDSDGVPVLPVLTLADPDDVQHFLDFTFGDTDIFLEKKLLDIGNALLTIEWGTFKSGTIAQNSRKLAESLIKKHHDAKD